MKINIYHSSAHVRVRCTVGKTMTTDNDQGSIWATIVAALAVTCTVGVLYAPLVLQ
jgi:hypothetical protein